MISLITRLSRRKITEDNLAVAFVSNLFEAVENAFPEVAGLINEDPDFPRCPGVELTDDEHFLMIVLVGNIKLLNESFDPELEDTLREKIIDKSSIALGIDRNEFIAMYKEYSEFLSRVNHPSKNILYAMARGVFYKYNLNHYQADYFRTLNTPNPIFLKRMNEVMHCFVWDWQAFFERYKVVL
jgi:hypothetical protein